VRVTPLRGESRHEACTSLGSSVVSVVDVGDLNRDSGRSRSRSST